MLARWVPLNGGMQRASSSLIPAVDSLFDEAFGMLNQPFIGDPALTTDWATSLRASADIVETADEVCVSVDLPGYDPKSLEVKLEGDTLTIQAERKQTLENEGSSYLRSERSYGRQARSFVLPSSVDGDKCQANYQHGVLTITLPKREEAKPRRVDVKVDS